MSHREPPPLTDRGVVEPNELVRRALAGCADSYTELSQRFRPRLLSLLRARLGQWHAEAEDIAQEALARAFHHLDRFDSRYRFSTWLYTIALRLASDHARRQKRRPHNVTLDVAHELPARSHVKTSEADEAEVVENLWHVAKQRLSELQYTALWLRYGEDLAIDEVAQAMGKTRIGVRVLLHRARAGLLRSAAHTAQFPIDSAKSSSSTSSAQKGDKQP